MKSFVRLPYAAAFALSAIVLVAYAADRGFNAPPLADQTAAATAQQFTSTGNAHRRNTPDEPNYDCAELDTAGSNTCSSHSEERYDLFGFPSSLTAATAKYADPADTLRFGKPQVSGYNASGAWKIQRGRPDVSVAVLDTGIRWNNTGIRTQIRLNRGELPLPQRANGTTLTPSAANLNGYDLNANGAFDVDDYANDARVNQNAGPNGVGGQVDGQDLIKTFSDGTDGDNNAFVDDIAGWDFFDDDNDANDASSYFAAGNHGTGRMEEVAERGNDGTGDIGVCPNCQIVPIRIWDTFVSDGSSFGMGILYAADNGVAVVEGANGSLTHTAFTEAASEYAWQKGLVQTFSGDDLNTGNHNFPAAYNHAMLIEGTVPDTVGLGTDESNFQTGREFFCQGPLAAMCPGSNAPVGTYFRSANTAQFGGKSSISMWGATGSQNTGRAAGAMALIVSAGRDFLTLPLSADEARIIAEQTAEDVTQPNTVGTGNPDLANPGWDSHFGWGRVDLGKAVQAVKDSNIPPEASINSPDWYAPLVGNTVSFGGVARARRSATGFSWKMEWGTGQAPGTWTQFATGTASAGGTVTSFGTLDLAAVRTALSTFVPPVDTGDATFAPGARHPLQDQFTVRLTVTVAGKMLGIDRKVLTAVPDGQALAPGYPKKLGSGGEAPIRYADINGDGVQELLVPTMDGVLHAYKPDGSELPGWPVITNVFPRASKHLLTPGFASGAVPIPREPLRGPTIADLDGNGKRQVVTAAGLRVYVWEANGTPRAGFPVKGDDATCAPDKQKQENLHPKCGFVASPAIAYINGRSQPPVIVAPSMDGNLYVWNRDGTQVSWSPRALQDITVPVADRQVAESIHNPAIGDLNGDGRDDIVVPTNEVYSEPGAAPALPSLPGNPADVGFGSVAITAGRVYAINGANGALLPGWPVRPGGIIQDVLPFIGPGADPALVMVNGAQQVVISATGSGVPGVGSGLATYNATTGAQVMLMKQDARGGASNVTDTSGGLNLFESAVIGDLTGAGVPAVVKYQIGRAQATNLLLVGQNNPYNHMMGAWNAATGANLEAFPTITDDYQFLSSSTVARMSATLPTQQVLTGTGLGLIHAYDGLTGVDIPGFPKVTGGWLFAPTAINDAGRMAAITREGYLFEWNTAHPACQTEWPSFRHDEQGSGNYDRDGTSPAAVRGLSATVVGSTATLAFTASGDDALCARAAQYQIRLLPEFVTDPQWLDPAAVARPNQAVAVDPDLPDSIALTGLAAGRYTVMIRVFDEVGNGSALRSVPITIGNPGGRLFFASATVVSANEAEGAKLRFNITRDLNTAGTASVNWAIATQTGSGKATQGTDYAAPFSGVVNFAAGAGSAFFEVPVVGDSLIEGNETFSVSLASPVGASLAVDSASTPLTAIGTITDDDSQLRFKSASYSGSEATGTAVIEVERIGSALGAASVSYASTTGGSAAANDFSTANGSLNWADGVLGSQTFSISLTDDARAEATETLNLALSAPSNSGLGETTLGSPATAELSIADNDTPGLRVTPTGGSIEVNEGGATDSFSVVLLSEPQFAVTVTVDTGNSNQISLSTTTLTFDASNWSQPQTVTVTAVDDADVEGAHNAAIGFGVNSADAYYQGLAVPSLPVSITDNDSAAVLLSELDGATAVTEGGAGDRYTLALSARPASDVVITLDDGAELLAAPASLTFTSDNWNVAQTVTVNAVDDRVAEGAHSGVIQHRVTGDAAFAGAVVRHVTVSITDNDVAGLVRSRTSLSTSEGGSADSYQVSLSSQPLADVTVTLDGGSQLAADSTTLVFTATNWNLARTVSVTAVDDAVVEGAHNGALAHRVSSSDAAYSGLAVSSLPVTIGDNDVAAVRLAQSGGGTTVVEGGADDSYTLVLTSQPMAEVTLTLDAGSQLAVSPATVTFTASNWNTPQTVLLNAIDDAVVEGAHGGSVRHTVTSGDAAYQGFALPALDVGITDNDTASVLLAESGMDTRVNEGGATDSYTLTLSSQPTGSVTITFDAGSQLAVSPTSITFDASNFGSPQLVTVSARDDAVAEGNHSGVVRHTVMSGDANYQGFALRDVNVGITDNDVAALVLSQTNGGTAVSEGGGGDSYTLALATQPTAEVSITVQTGSQLTLDRSTLVFTPSNYATPQIVNVGAVQDRIAEGDHAETIRHSLSSGDARYHQLTAASLTVRIGDDDVAAITLSQSDGNTAATEGGAGDSYTVVLGSQPLADVVVQLTADRQLALGASSLTFTPANYATPQSVSVSAVDDAAVEGSHSGRIRHTVSSSDASYAAKAIADVVVAITDNDVAAVIPSDNTPKPTPVLVVTPTGVTGIGDRGTGGGAMGWLTLLGLLALGRRRR